MALCTGLRGPYAGASYDIHLFDVTREGWVADQAFSELAVGTKGVFQAVDGRIRTSGNSGCCIHTESIYVVENDRPNLVERIVEESTADRATTRRRVSKLVDGRMRVVAD